MKQSARLTIRDTLAYVQRGQAQTQPLAGAGVGTAFEVQRDDCNSNFPQNGPANSLACLPSAPLSPVLAHSPSPTSYLRAWEVANGLVTAYELHRQSGQLIDLTALLAWFDLRFMELPPRTQGFTLDMGDKIIIALNDKLDHKQTRFVAAHEIAHVALYHPNQLNSCLKGQWFYDQLEKEASAVAAFLLLPGEVVAQGLHDHYTGKSRVGELEQVYGVPGELILLRRALWAELGR